MSAPRLTPAEALRLLLDQVDYTAGACNPTEMVAAVLDHTVIERCRDSLRAERVGINPTTADVGRKVVYRAGHPNAELEEGVITSFNDTSVFVRYGADVHSKGTDRRDLEWVSK